MSYDKEALDSNGKTKAFETLRAIAGVGVKQQENLIERVMKMTIKDKLVDPRSMVFFSNQNFTELVIAYGPVKSDVKEDVVRINSHALGQLADTSDIGAPYIRRLMRGCVGMPAKDRYELAIRCLNAHFHLGSFLDRKKHPAKFLHRIVDGELRGFLTRSFNRKLGTTTTLRPFIEQCRKHNAAPVEAQLTTTKVILKCVMPVIFEPVAGEFVAFGATYSNSDFGDGKLLVMGTVMRLSSGTIAVMEDKLSKVHLGALISENELTLSEETLTKEAEAYVGAIRDMVDSQFAEENVDRTLALIQYAHEKKLSWHYLKDIVRDLLNKGELTSLEQMLRGEAVGVVDLPPITTNAAGDREANAWWASTALSWIATKIEDDDRKVSVQKLAGKILS